MTEQQAMRMALEACPFCGGEAEYQKDSVRSGYGEYERHETYHAIKCKKCGSSSKRIHQKHLIDFTKYTVRDFRENPILRAKVEDDYDAYCEQSKQLAIDAWNCRALEQQPAAREPLTEWKPIQTAPKDTEVLLYCNKFIPLYIGKKRYGGLGEPQQDEFAWRCSSSGRFANPTHWMPLPKAPIEATHGITQRKRAIEAKLRERNGGGV